MSAIREFTNRNAGRMFVQFSVGGPVVPLGNAVLIAPPTELERAAFGPMNLPEFSVNFTLDTTHFDRGLSIFLSRLEEMERARIRRLWPRYALVFTLVMAAVALWT